MAALLIPLLVLSHSKPHARGERVSAGSGVEYMVGPDGLLYQTDSVKGAGKSKFRTAPLPGVLPEHVAKLTRSASIREAKGYTGLVATIKASDSAPVIVDGEAMVSQASYDAQRATFDASWAELTAKYDDLRAENEQLRESNAKLQAQLGGGPPKPPEAAPPPAAPSAPSAKPDKKGPPPPPPPALPPPPAAPPAAPSEAPPAGDNAVDINAALGVSVGKFGAAVASGTYDAVLPALRAAEVAGKNRTSALAVIDARAQSLGG